MIRIGLIGLPNAGKSTFFNIVSGANAIVANYPFSTVEPNKAVIRLHDAGLDALTTILENRDILSTELELWDIAGLIKDASKGAGMGSEFLGHIKDCDILIHIVRAEDKTTANDIRNDIETVLTETALFDHKILLKPFEKARRMARLYPGEAKYIQHSETISKAFYGSKEGKSLNTVLNKKEIDSLGNIGLISSRPRILLINSDGTDVKQQPFEYSETDIMANLLDLSALAELSKEELELFGRSYDEVNTFYIH